jgi:hypothetical protein
MNIGKLLQRYVGRRVWVSTYSHAKIVGEVASVYEDCVRLVNTSVVNELEDQGWYAQMREADSEDYAGPRQAESLIPLHSILVATCLDDDVPLPLPEEEDPSGGEPRATAVITSGADETRRDMDSSGDGLPVDRFSLEIGPRLVPLVASEPGNAPARTGDGTSPKSSSVTVVTNIPREAILPHSPGDSAALAKALERLSAGLKTGGKPNPGKPDHLLKERIAGLRRDIAAKAGWVFPVLRIRDSLQLEPEAYRILIHDCEVSRGRIVPGSYLAIAPNDDLQPLLGEETIEPAFGLRAYWIQPEDRRRAALMGYTVVEALAVIVTHLGEVIRRHAAELLGYEQVAELLQRVQQTSPTLVQELIPNVMSIRTVHYVLRRLLEERVSLKSLVAVLECLGQYGGSAEDLEGLLAVVRVCIGREICAPYRDEQNRVRAMVFHPSADQRMQELLADDFDPWQAGGLERLIACLRQRWEPTLRVGREAALVVDGAWRYRFWRRVHPVLPDLSVIAYSEIPPECTLDVVEIIQLEDLENSGLHTPEETLVPAGLSSLGAETADAGSEPAGTASPRLPR